MAKFLFVIAIVAVSVAAAYESCSVSGLAIPVPPGSNRCAMLSQIYSLENTLKMAELWLLADIKDQLYKVCQGTEHGYESTCQTHH
jgi:hypothetical protein